MFGMEQFSPGSIQNAAIPQLGFVFHWKAAALFTNPMRRALRIDQQRMDSKDAVPVGSCLHTTMVSGL